VSGAADVLKDMGSSLAHRGPDDHGIFLCGSSGLAFRRLSIIDLEYGHQPMESMRGDHVIVFNGEIYNYGELRRELKAAGSEFRTHSDTEVILAGYETWGADVVQRLRAYLPLLSSISGKKSFSPRVITSVSSPSTIAIPAAVSSLPRKSKPFFGFPA